MQSVNYRRPPLSLQDTQDLNKLILLL
uniref:Uncharacterized protein n=1 Tax=Anguilla anguilla TaxID=7936 RepID=A0A0E9QFN4_ANGAN